MSREFQSPVTRLSQTVLFCLVVIQLAWLFNFLHASHVCFILASHHSESVASSSCESVLIAHSWSNLHTLDQIFTLSHAQPLHYSHLRTGFLNTNYKQIWHGIKPIHSWINSTLQSSPLAILWQNPKTNSRLISVSWEQLLKLTHT